MKYIYREGDNVFLIEVHGSNYAVCGCQTFYRQGFCKHAIEAIAEFKKTKVRTEWKENPQLETSR